MQRRDDTGAFVRSAFSKAIEMISRQGAEPYGYYPDAIALTILSS